MKLLAVFLFACSTVSAQVPFERIVKADQEPGNWLSYSRTLQGQRYSPLAEINTQNASKLKVKWAYQFAEPRAEVSPIVIDGILYISGPNTAAALDGKTGRELWSWKRPLPSDYRSIGFGHTNRGPAVLDDKLYVATLDAEERAADAYAGLVRRAEKLPRPRERRLEPFAEPAHGFDSALVDAQYESE